MCVYIIVSGFVQGVGYRQFVKKTAIELALTGWVKNLPDRRVEILATGPKDKLEKLIKKCKEGSFLSKVRKMDEDWLEKDKPFDGFNIIL